MTLRKWMLEFYPIAAHELTENDDVIGHSMTKWFGLNKSNLRKHNVIRGASGYGWELTDGTGTVFETGAGTCSLCHVYRGEGNSCEQCPIFLRYGMECHNGTKELWGSMGIVLKSDNPYSDFLDNGETSGMLAVLFGLL